MATHDPDIEDGGSSEDGIALWISQLSFEEIPPAVIETVERAFVDTVGVILAGSRTEGGTAVRRVTETGTGSVPLLGSAAPSPSAGALVYGQAGHALDYDDVSWGMDGHPSTVLIPAILALSNEDEHGTETESKTDIQIDPSGRDAITAYVAGFETACAIAEPISPAHYQRGWHATATLGVFGAAAASAWLLDLTPEATRHALTIAASMPAGLKRNFGTMTKPLHAGLAARSGVTAAQLAQQGFTADAEAITGDRGFWDLYGDREDDIQIGEEWYIQNAGIHVKIYPCCYFMHTSIAATQELGREHDIQPDEVERIEVIASQGAADALPHENPRTGLEAKFSMQYAVASALVRDTVGLATFEDAAIDNSEVDTVRKQVAFDIDPTLAYDSHGATVRIETDRGIFDVTQSDPPGTHDHPPTESELRRKFFECAQPSLSRDVAADLHASLVSLRDVERLADVLSVQ